MRLKSIEMQGFKSFADKIYLDFNSGITAIVGPNGSGKSNISDAIRWVMGEQSIKSLRGSKMEDVIFAGTETRKALGFAEVTLILDNTDGFFDLDFPEIAVTRRVYRSGDGEFYINKTQCRLKDIHELFMDTGLGRDGYSIIGQGKIDNILSSKSDDRRQIFEEAAGISKYKYRKNEAEKKLEQTADNLTRVKDILGELEGQIEPLRKQSEKAKQYLKFRDELKDLEIGVSVISIGNIKNDLSKAEQDIGIVESQISNIKTEIEKTDQEISRMYEEVQQYDDEMEDCRQSDRRVSDAVNDLTNRINLLTSNMEHNQADMQRLQNEISFGNQNSQNFDCELAEHLKSLEALKSQSAGIDDTIVEFSEKAKQTGLDASDKNAELEQIKSDIIDKTAKISNIKGSVTNLNILIENFEKRQSVIEADFTEKGSNYEELKQNLDEIDQKITDKNRMMEELKRTINHLEEQYGEANASFQKSMAAKNEYTLRLSQNINKRNMLSEMENEFEGFAKGVKNVMTAYKKGYIHGADIRGPLSQLITTDKQYILAIETALGAANQNIVTQNDQDAKTAIRYLKEKRLGRVTFLPISAIRAKQFNAQNVQNRPGFVAVASDLVRCEEHYRNIVSSVLGTTVIADTLDNAVAIAKQSGYKFRIVTLGGDIVQAGGALTGGSAGKTTGSLSRASEIESLGTEIVTLKKQISKEEEQIRRYTGDIASLTENIKLNNEKLSGYSDEYIRMCSDRDHFDQLLLSMGESREQLENERKDIQRQISELNQTIRDNLSEIELETSAISKLEEQISKEQKLYAEMTGRNEELSNTLTELSIRKNSILKDIELQNERIQRINGEKSTLLKGISEKNAEIEELRKFNVQIEEEIQNSKLKISESSSEIESYQTKLEELTVRKKETETAIRTRQTAVKAVQENMFKLTQQLAKLEGRKSKSESELESIVSRMWEEYELTYSEALKLPRNDQFDFMQASKRIRELKESIRSLGNINIDSIEEYKNIKERFDFLTVQTNDLEHAKAELEKIIVDMLEIMQSRFAEQFRIINENFSRVFSEMFGGGQANLYLSDPDHILESGIEIEAQPPGKKLQSLTLLSGGERAFTAIALLFAILNVRPTPFCILDEIEAALDDVNVYRYADYLKQYSKGTQFIVVTHRRGTMEAANVLYGVTMQERGISKLLALNIDEVKG